MYHHEEAICLARSANGFVKICPPGCTHLTFGGITCNFDNPGQFQEMAEAFPAHLAKVGVGQNFRFDHNGIILELSLADAQEFGYLLAEAVATIAWTSGEMEFSDEDFQELLRRLSS